MDTKLKADIAESAVITELLSRGFNVLKPIGDRLSYDLAVDSGGRLIRIQVKSAWYHQTKSMYLVDSRRTKTNRRRMIRKKYSDLDFDIAIIYIPESKTFYIMPVNFFNSFSSNICFVEGEKRQRAPKSFQYREKWKILEEYKRNNQCFKVIL